jgi:hypothetical protein
MGNKSSKVAAPAVSNDNVASTPIPSVPESAAASMTKGEREQKLEQLKNMVEEKGGKMPDVLREGRYRIADQETTEAFYAQQPASMRMQSQVPKEVEGMTPQELKRYLTDTEGLNIGKHRMQELSQQWRLLLASDAVQHGIDAGILLGTLNAGIAAAFWPKKRHPVILLNHFFAAYAVGVIGFPMSLLAYEQIRTQQIIDSERDMFSQQRSEFYSRMKEAADAREPTR